MDTSNELKNWRIVFVDDVEVIKGQRILNSDNLIRPVSTFENHYLFHEAVF